MKCFYIIYLFLFNFIFFLNQINVCIDIVFIAVPHQPVPTTCIFVPQNSTAYDAMLVSANLPCHNFTYTIFPEKGVFIDSLCHVENDKDKHYDWFFYVNHVMCGMGVSKYEIQPNDNLTFIYRLSR